MTAGPEGAAEGHSERTAATGAPRPSGPGEPRALALALRGAARAYGEFQALRPLTLSIRPGERVAIVGPSGAGKSTLLRLLNTSLVPTAGEVEVLGQRVAALSPRALRLLRARVGTVYQQLLLVPQASVMQNVVAGRLGRMSLVRALAALVSRREAERVRAVLEKVGIAEKIFERVDRLSGGEQQRVAIARALYQEPELIVADEPLASVDPTRAADLVELFARAFAGRTFVVSTHRIEPLLPHVDRVIGLREGTLVLDTPAAALTLDDLGRLYAATRGEGVPPRIPLAPPRAAPLAATLAIGASNTPGEYVLPRAVRVFARAHPGVRVSLTLQDSAAVTAAVRAGALELGFVGARERDDALVFDDFAEDEIVAVASPALPLPEEPIPLDVVARLPRVDREPGSGTRAIVEEQLAGMETPLDPSAVVLEVGTLVALKAAVVSGMGIAFVSRRAVEDDLRSGHLRAVRVEGLVIPRHIFTVHRGRPGLSVAASAFLDVARETLRTGAP
jgi:phosphonate transport system ATP-binding protein